MEEDGTREGGNEGKKRARGMGEGEKDWGVEGGRSDEPQRRILVPTSAGNSFSSIIFVLTNPTPPSQFPVGGVFNT